MSWIRAALAAAIAGLLIAAGVAARSHWIGVGEARVQAAWDKQKKADTEQAAQQLQQAAANLAIQHRNAERTADEDHRREQDRLARLADAQRAVAGLRDAIGKLDADDLSAAAADPRVAAVARRAIAARGLLGQCSERYTALAGRAARLRDQATGLRDFALNVCRAGSAPAGESMKDAP